MWILSPGFGIHLWYHLGCLGGQLGFVKNSEATNDMLKMVVVRSMVDPQNEWFCESLEADATLLRS